MYQPRFYKYGEKGSGFRAPNASAVLDFNEIKSKCLQDGTLFEDPSFPAIQSSLFYSTKRGSEFQWLRPKDIHPDAKFITDDASRFDVKQGELGDCWLLAAIANLTLNKKLFHRVVPQDQSFEDGEYAGVFHFRFWRYGKWIDVVIDDLLPTYNGKLVFMHSQDRNEFWSALMEKAYAKLHGSYEALKGGSTCEALEDFTGGVTEYYELQSEECPSNLFQVLNKGFERSSFMGCSIDALDSSQMEAELPNGLIRGHAYSITSVRLVELRTSRVSGKIPLLRIRNPWGNEAEWKGPWSDKSKEWTVITDEEKSELQLMFDADGEFWMSFQDFKTNFTRLEICNLNPEPLDSSIDAGKQWEAAIFDGAWIAGVSAGGCRNHLQTFAMNPQYIVKLDDFDENDDNDKCTILVALMQKNRRAKRQMGLDALTIGFSVYALKEGHFDVADTPVYATKFKKQLLTTEYFKYNASVARSPTFINLREVCARFRLPPGNYCVIPSTYDPNEEGEFLLRLFTEQPPGYAAENDNEIGLVETDDKQKMNGVVDNVEPDLEPVKEEELIPSRPAKDQPPTPISRDRVNSLIELMQMLSACWSMINTATQNIEAPAQATKESPKMLEQSKKSENAAVEFFSKIAGDDMEVDAVELQQILNHALKKEFQFDGFSLDSCRSMVALLDDDKSGMLGIDEFAVLWKTIRHWSNVFRKYDADKSNTISASELRSALADAGLSVNRNILQLLIKRYGTITAGKKGDIKVERAMSFDAFISCCVKLKNSIDVYNEQVRNAQKQSPSSRSPHTPTFTIDEWVEKMMYC